MAKYIVQRLAQFLIIIFIANSLTFLLPRIVPGDPIEQAMITKAAAAGKQNFDIQAWVKEYRERFGLNQPLWKQYVNYWINLVQFDFGYSLSDYPMRVSTKIEAALPWTLGFMVTSTVLAFVVGTGLGAVLGWPNSPKPIRSTVPVLIFFSAVPFYLFGLFLIWIFAVELRILPTGGGYDPTLILRPNLTTVMNIVEHAVLPSLALILWGIGSWALGMRAMMVGVLGEDYITFAQAKGLTNRHIFLRYGLRNAMLPQITSLAISLGLVIGSGVLIETIFNYPGIGSLTFAAINSKDYFVINGTVFIMVLAAVIALLVVDLIYPLIDPRIRYQK